MRVAGTISQVSATNIGPSKVTSMRSSRRDSGSTERAFFGAGNCDFEYRKSSQPRRHFPKVQRFNR